MFWMCKVYLKINLSISVLSIVLFPTLSSPNIPHLLANVFIHLLLRAEPFGPSWTSLYSTLTSNPSPIKMHFTVGYLSLYLLAPPGTGLILPGSALLLGVSVPPLLTIDSSHSAVTLLLSKHNLSQNPIQSLPMAHVTCIHIQSPYKNIKIRF